MTATCLTHFAPVWPTRRCLAYLLLALFACLLLPGAAAGSPRSATLLLDWTPNTNHTGIYVALDKGWYREAGLDLKILPPGEAAVEAVVGAGRADFGISFQEWATSARVEGVPIVSIAAIIQHNTSGFASINRGIKNAADFAGKRYGGWGLPVEKAIIQGMMQADGADASKVRYINIGGQDDLLTLLGRDIDLAWIYYGWQGIEAERRGIKLDMVRMSDYFSAIPDYYTPIIITSENLIKRDPALVAAFMRATARGYEYAARYPAEAAGILIKAVPEIDAELVRRSQTWLSPRYIADAPRFGYQRQQVWQAFADWMYENGLIGTRLEAGKAFTNQFLP